MPNSSSASAAARMTGQSESEPITIPTLGSAPASDGALMGGSVSSTTWSGRSASLALVAEVAREPGGGVPGPLEAVVEVLAVGVHVADLAAGPQVLAVEVHPQVRVARERVREPVVEPAGVRV